MGKLSSGQTYRPWRPLWRNDLWASSNFKTLPINYKGLYEIIWSLCRDGEYAGMLCWPEGGVPWTIKELIRDMLPQPGDRIDRIIIGIKELMRRGMLYLKDTETNIRVSLKSPLNQEWRNGQHPNLVLIVRLYAEKSAQGSPEVGKRLAEGCQGVGTTPPDSKGIEDTKEPHKSKDIKSEEDGVAKATSVNKHIKREYPTPGRKEEDYNAPDLVGCFCKLYEEKTKLAYMPNFGKDGKLMAGLLKGYCAKSVINVIKYYFFTAEGTAWHADKLGMDTFIKMFNDMTVKLKEQNTNYIQMRIV